MKKKEAMQAVSAARRACERSTASLRGTATTYDYDIQKLRPTTEEERKEHIIQAWLWAHEASIRARQASSVVLAYARQNGISVDDINEYSRRTGR